MRISDCSSDVCSSDPGGDTDPGTYYLFDKGTSQLRPLILSRPELGGYKLASVKPVNVKASDGTLIPAYLTLPPTSSGRSEERRGGKEWVRTGRSCWSQYH